MPFPSRGCQTCKKRRVKCDAIQPKCSQCKVKARPCIWDPNDQAGLLFKSENAFARGQSRRPKRPKAEASMSLSLIPASQISKISTSLSIPLEEQAFHYWIENWMFRLEDLPDIGQEYSNYVLTNWVKSQPGSSLHIAFSAFSHAVFGRARGERKAIEIAVKASRLSIVKINKEMSDAEKLSSEAIDQLLIAIMLMGTFENIMYNHTQHTDLSLSVESDEVGSRFWRNVCHHKGAAGLLKLRREQGLPLNLPLDRVVRRQIIRVIILRGHTVASWLEDGSEYNEEGEILTLDTLMIRTANLRARSVGFRKPSPPSADDEQTWKEIAVEAETLDTALDAWPKHLPKDWDFSIHPCPPVTESPDTDLFYNGPVYLYRTHAHAAVWNRYRATRLIVNSIHLRALSHLQISTHTGANTTKQQICKENLYSLINDICGSVPFFFNLPNIPGGTPGLKSMRLGTSIFNTKDDIFPKMAILLAWPLTIAVCTGGTPEPQRKWLSYRLKIAAKSLGDSILESIAEKAEFRF